MKFSKKLLEGKLLKRYKRFFADVEYQGEVYTIHVPNTGSLKAVIEKEPKALQKCWFSLHGDKTKKLQGTLEAVQSVNGTWVGVNTSNPNKIVTEAIQTSIETKKPLFKHWKGYDHYQSEYKINKESRLDGLLSKGDKKHFIEIKNTTYAEGTTAMFPDAVTERGQKHLIEMMKLIDEGHQCELIFTIQRDDVKSFAPAAKLDPKYAELFRKAIDHGLIINPVIVHIDRDSVYLTDQVLPIVK